MQYYKVTAPNVKDVPELVVPFLGIFKPGETRHFNETEITSWEAMNGVPRASGLQEGWKLEKSSKTAAEQDAEDRQAAAQETQEKNVAALQELADKPGEEGDK